jgi:hypothetical protein
MPDFIPESLKMYFPSALGPKVRTVPTVFNTAQPGLVLVLIDQSSSMEHTWPNHGGAKSVEAANQVNKVISKILDESTLGNQFRERVFLMIYGYSNIDGIAQNSVRRLAHGWPEEFANHPGARNREWIQPLAKGDTPMALAFNGALAAFEKYFSFPHLREKFADSAPPVVINVTDGKVTEFERPEIRRQLRDSIQALKAFKSPQGFAPLVFHVQIADSVERKVYPTSGDGLDKFGTLLFQLASKIPDSWVKAEQDRRRKGARREDKEAIEMGSVGLVVGAGPNELMDLLDFASRPNSRC